MTLKAAIYDPYLDTLGGGERYCLTLAEYLIEKGYSVDLFWSGDKDILIKAQERFNLNISKINIVDDIFDYHSRNVDPFIDSESLTTMNSHSKQRFSLIQSIRRFMTRIITTRNYNLVFYISDWSVPFLFSKNNLLHIQVPFVSKSKFLTRVLNNIKLLFINNIICNSHFTKNFAFQQFGNKCEVVYPPVDIEKFSKDKVKENIILSVGRFDSILNSKKQDVLIDSFIKMNPKDWKLVLAGGSLSTEANNTYIQHLKSISGSHSVEIVVNPSFSQLKDLYEKSKIYWHAAGFGVDQSVHPENTEHFGMAPVEAMASGLVPILLDKGGLNEIVENGVSGILWQTTDQLIKQTEALMNSPRQLSEFSQSSIKRSQLFSKSQFTKQFDRYLQK